MSGWAKKRLVMRRYDLTASIYDMRYFEEQTAKIKAALRNVSLKRQSTVLDAGCGTGLLFGHIADKVKLVVGVDISRKTLQQAKKRAKIFPNVSLVLADVDQMPFPNASFSHIFAFTLLQNAPSPLETLVEIKRVSKGKGEIVITALKKVFTLEEFVKLFQNAGLKIDLIHGKGLKCYVALCVNRNVDAGHVNRSLGVAFPKTA
ncbi:MAG: class I SAM-dependent methyltransferase [Candidatus Bathyarchaeia archaeon]